HRAIANILQLATPVMGSIGMYQVWSGLLNKFGFAPYKVIDAGSYIQIHRGTEIKTLVTGRIGYTTHPVYNNDPDDRKLIPQAMSDLACYCYRGVKLHGDSDFIIDIDSDFVVNDFCRDMDKRFRYYDGATLRVKNNWAILRYDGRREDRHLSDGIMLSGRFSSNYYHQMYELMIRLLLLDKAEIPESVPLIVDEIVFRVESLTHIFNNLNSSGRKVITIGSKEVIGFDQLYTFSGVNQIPPHTRKIRDIVCTNVVFDLDLTLAMRDRLLVIGSTRQFPRRIFLTRKNTSHRHFNENEVFSLLQGYGFESVAPEEYSIEDQIALFHNAEVIVGGTGAAFTNLLFCSYGCKVICLQHIIADSSIFSTIARVVGVEMRYCTQGNKTANVHGNFVIEPTCLEATLYKMICCETL
ncbi:MAG: glycosyltransferase family 61 protein, partial [Bacteroidales bacterium]